MRALLEVTNWNESPNTPNHIYIVNSQDHLVGYIKAGTEDYTEFTKPLKTFSMSRRKFIELETKR